MFLQGSMLSPVVIKAAAIKTRQSLNSIFFHSLAATEKAISAVISYYENLLGVYLLQQLHFLLSVQHLI